MILKRQQQTRLDWPREWRTPSISRTTNVVLLPRDGTAIAPVPRTLRHRDSRGRQQTEPKRRFQADPLHPVLQNAVAEHHSSDLSRAARRKRHPSPRAPVEAPRAQLLRQMPDYLGLNKSKALTLLLIRLVATRESLSSFR